MRIGEAKVIAAEWVRQAMATDPTIVGAVLHGSANWQGDDEEIAPSSDLDVLLIHDGDEPAKKIGKFRERGLLLEISGLKWSDISHQQALLANYQLVGSFSGRAPLADRSGRLGALIEAVAAEYAKPEWVLARINRARQRAVIAFPLRAGDAIHQQVTSWLFSTGALCHIVLVGALENPTVRKRYLAARGVLERHGFAHEYEAMLDLLGCREMTAGRVSAHLDALSEVFDAALRLPRGDFFFSADISEDARSVAIGGSRELIDAGNHREAIFWIVATYCRCRNVFEASNAPGAFEPFEAGFRGLLGDLGVATFADCERQVERSRAEIPRVGGIAEAILARSQTS